MLNRKKQMLLNLKQQVEQMKRQLDCSHIPTKNTHSSNNSRMAQTCTKQRLFNVLNHAIIHNLPQSSGVKKFPKNEDNCANISQLISRKSMQPKRQKLSSFRQKQYSKVKQNFAMQLTPKVIKKQRDPNPITGEGYKSHSSNKYFASTCFIQLRRY